MTGGIPPIRSELIQSAGGIGRDWSVFFSFLGQMAVTGSGIVRSGTRAQRLAIKQSEIPDNAIFIEDTGPIYQSLIDSSTNARYWKAVAGSWSGVQADLPTLGTADAGVLAFVTDFSHALRWDGSAWGWAPGENGSGYDQFWNLNPPTVGWALYNGSTVTYLKSDGTTATIALADLTSSAALAAYLKAGSASGGPNVAVAPHVTGTPATDSAVTGISFPAATQSGGAVTTSAPTTSSQIVQSGSGVSVASATHPHTGGAHPHDLTAPTDTGHVHNITAASITIDDTGEPRNLVRRLYFRL